MSILTNILQNISFRIVVIFVSTIMMFINTTTAQIQLLNDEFDNSISISNWQDINQTEGWNIQQLEWMNINDSIPGHFQIAPQTSSWYNEWKGALMYKELTGDFVLTTEVFATGRNRTELPNSLYSLAGILLRSPTTNTSGQAGWSQDEQNYIFLAVGTADNNCNGPCTGQLEVKTTTNSNSVLSITDIPSTHVQLRFARMASHFIILYRLMPDGDWTIHRRYNRADFPETLQVGFTTYTDWTKVQAVGHNFHNNNVLVPGVADDPAPSVPFAPDLIADFNFYRLDSLSCPIQLNCTSPSAINNTDVLSFLNYPTAPFCHPHFRINQAILDMPFYHNIADTISFSSSISNSTIMNLECSTINLRQGAIVDNGGSLQVSNNACP